MPLDRPFRLVSRQLIDGSYANNGNGRYVSHAAYAKQPAHYVRAFLLLQDDLKRLFEFVEPADQNLNCYSFRIHELLMRACIEVEANCKAILQANGYADDGFPTMYDYIKINASHRLSSYEVRVPTWDGAMRVRKPFAKWHDGVSLPWYKAYNESKHDRHANFKRATFEHALDAIGGCAIILAAQFRGEDFNSLTSYRTLEGGRDGWVDAIGRFFQIKYADDWPVAERYEFKWSDLEGEADPFVNFPYPPKPPRPTR
ncbi:hypothetical protein M2282_003282 [Variovorax boronicumulans]|uniref:hypothetical protein n=1 Tax=Variovorax boronicumulans TaxID=436515 RepID=UPI0024762078|nr:hypothetical protein [Variovorax boronicumulans]MDH6168131.1 hypothetical protein [Variovorax boronicumulans]